MRNSSYLATFVAALLPLIGASSASATGGCPGEDVWFCTNASCSTHICGTIAPRIGGRIYPGTYPPQHPCAGRLIVFPHSPSLAWWDEKFPYVACGKTQDRSAVQGPRSQMQGTPDVDNRSPEQRTRDELSGVLGDVPGLDRRSPQVEALLNALSTRSVSAQTAAQAGRFVASQLGVGSCTRHFYNNTDSYWAVAMINSGFCHVDGDPQPDKPACMIPPRKVATLKYHNSGNDNITNAGIAIAGWSQYATYHQYFRLRIVGCYIEHRGNTGAASLNSPADGDVNARW